MTMLATLSLVLLLPALAAAQAGCSYEGKSYAHLDPVPHANGCTKFQCQNGTVVVIEEACGKEVDSNCHLVNVQFTFKNNYYVCRKTTTGGTVEYKNGPAPPPAAYDCTAEGKQFKHLEDFNSSTDGLPYQCQDGTVSPLFTEDCQFVQDSNQCYKFRAQYEENGKLYEFVVVKTANEEDRFEVIPVEKTFHNCTVGSNTYQHLEIFQTGNGCQTSQCYNGQVVDIQTTCKDVSGQCYSQNWMWKIGEDVYQCFKQDPWGWTVTRIYGH